MVCASKSAGSDVANWYEVGGLYVWHNQVGEAAYLNGTETVVTGDICDVCYRGELIGRGQPTSTIADDEGNHWYAEPGDLRRKEPPPGQQSIINMFKQPQLEPA